MKIALGLFSIGLGGAFVSAPQNPAPVPDEPELGLRPVTYFNEKCARCHGEAGSRYGDLSKRTDEQLKQAIREMANGPGDAPLSEAGLSLQLALHRAIRAQEPFVAIVSSKNGKVEGEAFPGASVVLWSKRKATKLETKEGRFAFETKDPKAAVAVRAGNKVATIPARRVGTSHDAPAKSPDGTVSVARR